MVLRDVVVTLGVAVALGVVAQALRQSPVIGYLIAGLILGGHGSLELIDNVSTLEKIAELGVAMLLFSIGLDFSFDKLRRFGRTVMIGGLLQISLTMLATYLVLRIFGVSSVIAIVVAMMVALSSTAVVVRVLFDHAQIDSVFGYAAIGVLLVQDIVLIPFLLLIPDLASNVPIGEAAVTFGFSIIKIILLAVAMYMIDYVVVVRTFNHVGNVAEREELLVLVTMVIAFGAAWATHAMGLSAALGAFIAGLMIAGAPYADHVRAEIGPIRVVFVTLFFASIGMLADIGYIIENAAPIFGLVAAVIVGKALIAGTALRLSGTHGLMAVLAGIALAQMGEFSFVIAQVARSESIITTHQFHLIISVSLITLLVTPVLLGFANRMSARGAKTRDALGIDDDQASANHHVVIGYGPAGQRVTQRLAERGMNVTVIELNPHLGGDAPGTVVHGDAGKMQILRSANITSALSVTITIPDPSRAQGIARRIRAIAPDAKVIVRGRYFRSLADLRAIGVHTVVDEESETGERLAQATLRAIEIIDIPS